MYRIITKKYSFEEYLIYKILLRMKWTGIMLLVGMLQLSANTNAQKVSLSFHNAPLEKVLNEIKKQSGYDYIIYSSANLSKAKKISIETKSVELSSVLKKIFKDQPFKYSIASNTIIVKEGKSSREFFSKEQEIQQVLRGKVQNEKGEPIVGATVQITDKKVDSDKVVVYTNSLGNFEITINPDSEFLEVSSVGYITFKTKISAVREVITLQEAVTELEDIVVVGYGVQKKANLTGAISSVDMKDVIGNRPISSTSQALQGAIPGLQVTTNSGRPGLNSSINVRGMTSINGGTPLVLMDNVPVDIDKVNPQDIETVTVLKDAAASSIYGARASFGVILITTKKGSFNQPTKIDYNGNFTSTNSYDLPEKATPLEMIQALKNWGTQNYWTGQNIDSWLKLLQEYEGNPSLYPEGKTVLNGLNYPLAKTDVIRDMMEPGFELLQNLSLTGGNANTAYRISLGYVDEDGILYTSNDRYKKYNLNASINTKVSESFSTALNVLYLNDNQTTPKNIGTLFRNAISVGSFVPTGTFITETGEVLPYNNPDNLLKYESPRNNFGDQLRLFGMLKYSPFNGFDINAEYTFTKSRDNDRATFASWKYINATTYDIATMNPNSSYARNFSNTDNHALNVYASYEHKINSRHALKGLLGVNYEKNSFESINSSRNDLLSSSVPSLSTSTGITQSSDSFNQYALSGYFGRINYAFENRYLLELNGRFDGSSRFPKGRRFGFFPSMSFGWNISEEKFMLPYKSIISELKIRGSHGEIGNQVYGHGGVQNYYPHFSGLETRNVEWIDPATNVRFLGLTTPSLVSANFTWETVSTSNLGVDLGLWNHKLQVNFDIYRRKTSDMLAEGSKLPATLGAKAPIQNVADLQTDGWELALRWKDKINELKYSLGFNLSDNQAKITKFDNPAGLLSQYYVGQRLGEIWGFTTQGFFTVDDFESGSLDEDLMNGKLKEGIAPYRGTPQNPGDIRYVDLNGDGEIFIGNETLDNPGDRSVIGNNNRRFQYGITGALEYKNVDMSFFLQGVAKRDIWISNQLYWPYQTNFEAVYKHHLDYWTPGNSDAFYPRNYRDATGNTGISRHVQTKYLSNGAYLRVRNITLGYTFPQDILKGVFIKNVRLFLSGENLFVFKHTPKGIDPEINYSVESNSGGAYPFLRKYSFGLNLNF